MSELYYSEALKLGQKAARGKDAALPVLDEILPPDKQLSTVDLGVVAVPAEFIVGTKSRGRTEAFAPNFMPLLPLKTEFSGKWAALCSAHLAEGIREPVKVYEYFNRFYVAEGNKRVSVLKFFDAPTIPAHVIRILPERNGEARTELYYEFVAFWKLSRVGFLELTKPGGYAHLQRLLGKGPGETWTEEERRRFAAVYYRFRKVYAAAGGGKIRATEGDALLAYLKVYGYPALRTADDSTIRKNLSDMWEEVALQQEDTALDVKMDPAAEKKGSILTKVLPTGQNVRKVAFLYDKTPATSGWTLGHEQGRRHVQRVFEGQIEAIAYENIMEGEGPEAAMERAMQAAVRHVPAHAPGEPARRRLASGDRRHELHDESEPPLCPLVLRAHV